MPRQLKKLKKYSREKRVAACADYLLGMKGTSLEAKYGIKSNLIAYWVKRAGFKLRHDRKSRRK